VSNSWAWLETSWKNNFVDSMNDAFIANNIWLDYSSIIDHHGSIGSHHDTNLGVSKSHEFDTSSINDVLRSEDT
jgi:hypothetical protein